MGSECHVPTQYSWIGVSRSDTIILKEKHVELMEGTQSQITQLPKWFDLEAWVLMCNVIDTCSCCLLFITFEVL